MLSTFDKKSVWSWCDLGLRVLQVAMVVAAAVLIAGSPHDTVGIIMTGVATVVIVGIVEGGRQIIAEVAIDEANGYGRSGAR